MGLTVIDNGNIFQKAVIGRARTAQEDSHDIAALTPNGDVFVVCDGMGGHVGGKQASSIAVKSIIDYLKKERYPRPIQALDEALQFANMQILGYANDHPELRGMGTTACIVLLQDSEAYIAHVGDSRIYLYLGKEKQLHRITKDHSFVQTLVDAGQITDEEAERHPNKNRILKALGIKPDLAPSFDRVQPKNGDVFLICSDGLSGMISDSTMREVLMQNTGIGEKGEMLIGLALEAGGLDNITLELIRIANSPYSKSAFRNYNPAKTKFPTHSKWKQVVLMAVAGVIVLISCSLLFYRHAVKRIENRLEITQAEIERVDSLILTAKDNINEYKNRKKVLSDDFKEKASKIDGSSRREELKRNYDKQCRNIEADIEAAEKKVADYGKLRDSLIKAQKIDATRRTGIQWKNKRKK